MKGYFLPDSGFSEKVQSFGGKEWTFPDLDPVGMLDTLNSLLRAQEKLAAVPILDLVDWIDAAVSEWRRAKHPIRRELERQLPALCGLSKEMVQVVLDDLLQQLARPVLLQLLEAELGDLHLLDRFRKNKYGVGMTRAIGPRLMTHILPGNVLGVSLVSLVCGLLVKSASLIRVSHAELLLTVRFAESLQQVWPEMAQSIGVLSWDKELKEVTEAAFQKADFAIVYGSNETIASLREKIPPGIRAVYHGHKVSLGVISRELMDRTLAEKVALDIALYDQRGCLSPHLYYVESGGDVSPVDFASFVAEALDGLSSGLPIGEKSPSEAARIQQIRGALPLKGGEVFSSQDGVDWTVLYDPEPTFTVSPLSRTIWVKPVQNLLEVKTFLEPVRGLIQTIGLAAPEVNAFGLRMADLIEVLAKVGGCRICPIGKMQRPPLTWHHDGAFRLLPLLRFVDWEK